MLGGTTEQQQEFLELITGEKHIETVENTNGVLSGEIDGKKVQITPENEKEIKNKPFIMKLNKENLQQLFKFDEIIVKTGTPFHAYSIELNKDGTVTLHEPYNSNIGISYTVDEFLNLSIVDEALVMVL